MRGAACAFHLRLRDNGRVLARAGLLRHARRKLEGGKRCAAVAARQEHDGAAGSRVERIQAVQPARVGNGPVDQLCHIAVGEPLETNHTRAADKSGVHLENGFSVVAPTSTTVRFSTAYKSASCWLRLNRWISSTNRMVREPVERQALLGGVDFPAQVGYGAADGRHLHERGLGGFGDNVRDGGFAGSRRVVEDDRADVVLLDGCAQPAARAHGILCPTTSSRVRGRMAHRQRRHLLLAFVLHCRE